MINAQLGVNVRMRVGVHVGWVVTGVVGRTRPRFHIYGPTVLTAEKMEQTGQEGRIHCSPEAQAAYSSSEFEFHPAASKDISLPGVLVPSTATTAQPVAIKDSKLISRPDGNITFPLSTDTVNSTGNSVAAFIDGTVLVNREGSILPPSAPSDSSSTHDAGSSNPRLCRNGSSLSHSVKQSKKILLYPDVESSGMSPTYHERSPLSGCAVSKRISPLLSNGDSLTRAIVDENAASDASFGRVTGLDATGFSVGPSLSRISSYRSLRAVPPPRPATNLSERVAGDGHGLASTGVPLRGANSAVRAFFAELPAGQTPLSSVRLPNMIGTDATPPNTNRIFYSQADVAIPTRSPIANAACGSTSAVVVPLQKSEVSVDTARRLSNEFEVAASYD